MKGETPGEKPKGSSVLDNVGQLRPHALAEQLRRPDRPLLLDVRELEEWQLCRIAGAVHLPLNQLAQRLEELDREREVVIYCHHGIRSQLAAELLSRQGFLHVRNLVGGIDAWSREVDPRIPRY
jgi:adenylyltransferase/sulfurtransferase